MLDRLWGEVDPDAGAARMEGQRWGDRNRWGRSGWARTGIGNPRKANHQPQGLLSQSEKSNFAMREQNYERETRTSIPLPGH